MANCSTYFYNFYETEKGIEVPPKKIKEGQKISTRVVLNGVDEVTYKLDKDTPEINKQRAIDYRIAREKAREKAKNVKVEENSK